jgi:hypothetical protein
MFVCRNPLCNMQVRWALTKDGWRLVDQQNRVHRCGTRRHRLMNAWLQKNSLKADRAA